MEIARERKCFWKQVRILRENDLEAEEPQLCHDTDDLIRDCMYRVCFGMVKFEEQIDNNAATPAEKLCKLLDGIDKNPEEARQFVRQREHERELCGLRCDRTLLWRMMFKDFNYASSQPSEHSAPSEETEGSSRNFRSDTCDFGVPDDNHENLINAIIQEHAIEGGQKIKELQDMLNYNQNGYRTWEVLMTSELLAKTMFGTLSRMGMDPEDALMPALMPALNKEDEDGKSDVLNYGYTPDSIRIGVTNLPKRSALGFLNYRIINRILAVVYVEGVTADLINMIAILPWNLVAQLRQELATYLTDHAFVEGQRYAGHAALDTGMHTNGVVVHFPQMNDCLNRRDQQLEREQQQSESQSNKRFRLIWKLDEENAAENEAWFSTGSTASDLLQYAKEMTNREVHTVRIQVEKEGSADKQRLEASAELKPAMVYYVSGAPDAN